MIDRYAPAQAGRPSIEPPEVPSDLEVQAPELTPLHLDRDERLASERSAA
jgi:hypothetical protein